MNWTRVWLGAALAGAALLFFDVGNLILTQRILTPEPNLMWSEIVPIAGNLIIPSLVLGFLLCWMYVLARPRLGPGPKTALIIGSIGFLFANSYFIGIAVWTNSPLATLVQFALLWFKFASATYLAGWQYLEKA